MGIAYYLMKTRAHLMLRFKRICEERCYDDRQVWAFRTSKMSKERLAELVCQLEEEGRGASVPPTVGTLEKASDDLLESIEVMKKEHESAKKYREAVKNSGSKFVDEAAEYRIHKRRLSDVLVKFSLAVCASPMNQAVLDEAVAVYAHLEGYADLRDAEAALTVRFMDWQNSEKST